MGDTGRRSRALGVLRGGARAAAIAALVMTAANAALIAWARLGAAAGGPAPHEAIAGIVPGGVETTLRVWAAFGFVAVGLWIAHGIARGDGNAGTAGSGGEQQ